MEATLSLCMLKMTPVIEFSIFLLITFAAQRQAVLLTPDSV